VPEGRSERLKQPNVVARHNHPLADHARYFGRGG
jgi:hypothetical protein